MSLRSEADRKGVKSHIYVRRDAHISLFFILSRSRFPSLFLLVASCKSSVLAAEMT